MRVLGFRVEGQGLFGLSALGFIRAVRACGVIGWRQNNPNEVKWGIIFCKGILGTLTGDPL